MIKATQEMARCVRCSSQSMKNVFKEVQKLLLALYIR